MSEKEIIKSLAIAGSFIIAIANLVILFDGLKQLESSRTKNDEILALLRKIDKKLA